MIGLDPEECERPQFAAVFSGSAPLPQGVRPYAQNYGGHQFGMVCCTPQNPAQPNGVTPTLTCSCPMSA